MSASKKLKGGQLLIEVVSGREGNCLVIGDDSGGYRLSGPKPWGGGRTIHRFVCDAKDIARELAHYLPPDGETM